MSEISPTSGEAEAVILIKTAPQVGQRHGETVCCAGIDLYGRWLRLYPVSFRSLDRDQKFSRWDRVSFKWRRPKDDPRPESRRADQATIEVVGQLKRAERDRFLSGAVVTGLAREREAGRQLGVAKARDPGLQLPAQDGYRVARGGCRFEALRAQGDLFAKQATPHRPCPYRFKYRYRTDDGEREGTCQDWEIEATFFYWSRAYGEHRALAEMERVFGDEYPQKGMPLAMGTHSLYPDTWLINGVVRLDDIAQGTLF